MELVILMSFQKNPPIDYVFTKAGKDIPIYKLTHIIGTVISKK